MSRVVDCQWHWYPESLLRRHAAREEMPRARLSDDVWTYEVSTDEVWTYDKRFTDLEWQVAKLDECGIDVAVVSCAVAGDLNDRESAEATELCILVNEEMSRAQRLFPGRFVGLAHIPLKFPDQALQVLDDAASRLSLGGVWLPGNIDGESIGREDLWPVYARCEALGLPVFLHPTRSFRIPRVRAHNLEIPIGYMFDTSFASMALITSGVLDRFPQLKIVHPHAGGTLPYLHGRVEVYRRKGWWPNLERPFVDYLRSMYFDTVCNQPETLRLLASVVGTERMLYSSDYPYWSPRRGLELVTDTFSEEDASLILGRNASAVLGLDLDHPAVEGRRVDAIR